MKIASPTLLRAACILPLLLVSGCSDSEPGGDGGSGSGSIAGAGSPAGGMSASGAGGVTASGAGGTNASGSGGTNGGGGASAGGVSGSGGASGGAAPGTPTFTQVAKILDDHCGSKCHSADAEGKISLSSADPGGLYVRLTSPIDLDLCFGAVPVQKGFASISLLSTVVKAAIDKPCPLPRMPYGCEEAGSCLSEADIAIIDGWINAGAFEN